MLEVTLSPDEAPMSPRVWGNLGKMWCEHQRYTLGDDCPWWWQQLLNLWCQFIRRTQRCSFGRGGHRDGAYGRAVGVR